MPTTWILLRGLVREQAHWNGFADRLAGALGADHRVMCMDLPGNGVRHRDRSPTRIAAMVDAALHLSRCSCGLSEDFGSIPFK